MLSSVLTSGFFWRAILAGSFLAVACGLLGVFPVLRQDSMISHGLSQFGLCRHRPGVGPEFSAFDCFTDSLCRWFDFHFKVKNRPGCQVMLPWLFWPVAVWPWLFSGLIENKFRGGIDGLPLW